MNHHLMVLTYYVISVGLVEERNTLVMVILTRQSDMDGISTVRRCY